MNKTRQYRERNQESIKVNILHVNFDSQDMYEKAKDIFDSDGESRYWAGDWMDDTMTIEFAETGDADTLKQALAADMENAGISGYHIDLRDTVTLEPEGEKKVKVLCFYDQDEDYKGLLMVANEEDVKDSRRQEITDIIRPAFCDEDEFDDQDEEELFQNVITKIIAGEGAEFHEYSIYWDTTVML